MTKKIDKNGNALVFGWCTLAIIVFGVILAIRIGLLGIPLERDEGEYAYAGQLMLQGIPPYKLAYSMKFPGTYAAYALIMSIFGQTIPVTACGSRRPARELCRSLRESFRPWFGCSRDAFCSGVGPWWNAAFARRIGTPTIGTIVRERTHLWSFNTNEAARCFFRCVCSDLSRLQRCPAEIHAKGHSSAKPGLQCRRNSPLWDCVTPSLARGCLR